MEKRQHVRITKPPSRVGPCPCGSQKRYKDCHGSLIFDGITVGGYHKGMPTPDQFRKMMRELNERADLKEKFGEVRFCNTVEFAGKRFVPVGGTIYEIDPKLTPANFMGRHMLDELGREWWKKAVGNGGEGTHPMAKLYSDMMDYQQRFVDEETGMVTGPRTGPATAWLLLAYDIWVVSNAQLLAPFVARLRNADQFQGARYELSTCAHFLRAGFELHLQDEHDNTKPHTEFEATHKVTKERVTVEAKSRHRHGVLGHKASVRRATAKQTANIRGSLEDAIRKASGALPYVVVVDLNLPPGKTAEDDSAILQEAAGHVNDLTTEYATRGEPFPISMVLLTNYAHHYGDNETLDPRPGQALIQIGRAAHQFAHEETRAAILKAFETYGNFPQAWSDLDL